MVVSWLKNQAPGAARMAEFWTLAAQGRLHLRMSALSAVEVFYLTARKKGVAAAEQLLAHLRSRPLELLPLPDELVWDATRPKARYPISLADAVAAATAIKLNLPLATGDPALRLLEADGALRLEWTG